jgi:hypothetical protein
VEFSNCDLSCEPLPSGLRAHCPGSSLGEGESKGELNSKIPTLLHDMTVVLLSSPCSSGRIFFFSFTMTNLPIKLHFLSRLMFFSGSVRVSCGHPRPVGTSAPRLRPQPLCRLPLRSTQH